MAQIISLEFERVALSQSTVYTNESVIISVDVGINTLVLRETYASGAYVSNSKNQTYALQRNYKREEENMAVNTVKATINGQEYTLTKNSDGSYSATITAPSTSSYNQEGGYYPVSVTATDEAGNSTTVDATDTSLGEDLRLVVKATNAPVITITSPTNGSLLSTSTPTITWSVSDSDSGVATSTIKIDSGTAVTVTGTAITSGYTYSYTPSSLADGSHTITINAENNDGNSATAVTATFTIDTVPPVLTILSPTDPFTTNQTTVTISGTTSDVTSNPVTLTVNGTAVTVASDGSFSTTKTLVEGSNSFTITATDNSGRATTITRFVILDTFAPTFSSVTITPNPVDCGQTFIISVEVTDEDGGLVVS